MPKDHQPQYPSFSEQARASAQRYLPISRLAAAITAPLQAESFEDYCRCYEHMQAEDADANRKT